MSKIIVSAHQPNFLPIPGYFDKMNKSDIFVIRDEVLFVKKDYHQRNKIRINGKDNYDKPQFKWLKVPVEDNINYIKNIKIKKGYKIKKIPWNVKLLNDIKAGYKGSEYFDEFYPRIKNFLDNSEDNLISLNMKFINFFKEVFEIDTEIIMASDLGLKGDCISAEMENGGGNASEDLAEISKELNADIYLSGSGGRDYLQLDVFKNKKIEVEFQRYNYPMYKQKFPGFLPYMCSLDLLFCEGKMDFNSK